NHRRRRTDIYRPRRLPGTQAWMRAIQPTAQNLRQQATLTIEGFQDGRFQFFSCEPLRRDLLKLRVEEKSYGFRLVSPRDGEGHGDSFSAFALALVVGHELAGKKPIVAGLFNDAPTGVGSDRPTKVERVLDSLARQRQWELRDRQLMEARQADQH